MAKKLAPICFLILSCSIVCAQQRVQITDSLLKALTTHPKEDTARIDLLLLLADAFTHQSPQRAMTYTDSALALSRRIGWQDGVAMTFRQQGTIYYVMPDYLKALDRFQQALKAGEPMKDKLFNGSILNNMGMIYSDLGMYDKALINYNAFLKDLRELGMDMQESIVLNNIAFNYSKQNDLSEALASYRQGLAIAEKKQYVQVAAYHLNGIGGILNKQGDCHGGLSAFEKSIQYAIQAGDDDIRAGSLQGMGESYLLLKDYARAENYSRQSLQISDKLNLLDKQKDSYQILSDVYEQQHKNGEALKAFRKYIQLRDSILDTEKKQEFTRKEMEFAFEKKAALIKAENDRKQVLATAEIRRQQIVKNALAAGALILLIGSVSSFVLYKRRRDADTLKKQAELRAEIADTEMKALRAQMNPHFIFNSLNSINDYIDKHDPATATLFTTKFARLMRMILENSEKKEVSLADDLEALELYMQLEALRLHQKFSYQIEVDKDIDRDNTLIPPLMLQPFVENSIWHGIAHKHGSGKIIIQIHKKDDMICCTVQDDGIGRELAKVNETAMHHDGSSKSMGLRITQQRINMINAVKKSNASVMISDMETGTKVEMRLPLETIF